MGVGELSTVKGKLTAPPIYRTHTVFMVQIFTNSHQIYKLVIWLIGAINKKSRFS